MEQWSLPFSHPLYTSSSVLEIIILEAYLFATSDRDEQVQWMASTGEAVIVTVMCFLHSSPTFTFHLSDISRSTHEMYSLISNSKKLLLVILGRDL